MEREPIAQVPEDTPLEDTPCFEAMDTEDRLQGAPEEEMEEEESLSPSAVEAVALYLKNIARSTLLTSEEEIHLAKKIAEGDDSAREAMIEANLRLVVCLAKRYIHSGLPLSDLIEEGNIGLIHAVEKYDYKRGFRFSTYAAWWIRQNIQRAIINNVKVVRLPVHAVEQINRYLACLEDLVQERGRAPELFEIAHSMGISEKKVLQTQQLLKRTHSLDAPLAKDTEVEITLQDVLADTEQVSPGLAFDEGHRRGKLMDWLRSLSKTERYVVLLRFGFIHDESWTLEQIGKELGLTRERVRQIEGAALKALRRLVCKKTKLQEIL